MRREQVRRLKIGLTYRCNGRCLHCAMKSYPRVRREELALAELERVAIEGRMLGVRSVVLFGGEPTLRRDLLEVIRSVQRHIPFVLMDSNGLLVDEAFARELLGAGLGRIQISLDGWDRETHRAIRGMDTFDEVVRAIRACVSVGLETHVLTTTSRMLYESGGVPKVIALVKALGAQGLRLLYPALAGNWSDELGELLSPEEQADVARLADGDFVYLEGEGQTAYACKAVFGGFFYVGPYGEVQPCYFIPMAIGDVRHEPLIEVARRGTTDVPMLDGGRFFQDDYPCIMTHLRAVEAFADADKPLAWAQPSNVVDIGGGGDEAASAIVDKRPPETLDAISSRLDAVAQDYAHLYLCGGDPCSRADFPEVATRIAARGLAVTLVGDPRSLFTPGGVRLPDGFDLHRVVVPLRLDGGPDLPGLPTDEASLRRIADATARLRARGVPVELLVFDWTPTQEPALSTLVALNVEQVTNVVLRPSGELVTPERPSQFAEHLPWLPPERVQRAEMIAWRGDVLPDHDRRPNDLLSRERLDRVLRAEESLADTAGDLAIALDFAWLDATRLSGLERLFDTLGPRERPEQTTAPEQTITLRQRGEADHLPSAAIELFETYLSLEGQDIMRRLNALQRRLSGRLRLVGFGLPLFRPWSTIDQVLDLGIASGRLDEIAPELRDELLYAGLRDDPPPEDPALARLRETLLRERDDDREPSSLAERFAALLQRASAPDTKPPNKTTPASQEASAAPRSEAAERLVASAAVLHASAERFLATPGHALTGWIASPFERFPKDSAQRLIASLRRGDRRLDLLLFPGDSSEDALFVGEHLRLGHASETPPLGPEEVLALRALAGLLDEGIALGDGDSEAGLSRALRVAKGERESHDDRSAPATLLAQNLDLMRKIAERLADSPRSPLPGWELIAFERRPEDEGFSVAVTLRRDERRLDLTIVPCDDPRRGVVEGERVKLLHAPETPPGPALIRHGLPGLVRLLDHYLGRAAARTRA